MHGWIEQSSNLFIEPFFGGILHFVDDRWRCGEMVFRLNICIGHGTKTTKTKETLYR